MNAKLIRHPTDDGRTFGVLVLDNGATFQTLEHPWRNNERNVSCIPAGWYDVRPYKSPSKGMCFKVYDVPGRDDILIHIGNLLKDTLGCILIGLERAGAGILHSKAALNELFTNAPDGFRLHIIEEGVA